MQPLTSDYWDSRWQQHLTGWDLGQPSPPLMHFADALTDTSIRILIPGAGSAHEAIYLHRKGFTEVYVCDWAATAFEHIRNAAPDFPEAHLLVGDFFELPFTSFFDLVLEQTFFCAIDPALRDRYVAQMHHLLQPKGKLAGVLFASEFEREGPPFGGTQLEYMERFSPYFDIIHLDITPFSAAPRLGNELWMELVKK
ncbi:MAG: methyltransferase domain-containing protein [Saprospiraceae bacterium]